jgi:hypothetical protein
MSNPSVPLAALTEAVEALRMVKDLPGNATLAEWSRAAHRCAHAYGHLGYHVDKITSAAQVEVTEVKA